MPPVQRRLWACVLTVCSGLAAADPAKAAGSIAFHIPRTTLSNALIQAALQAHVSIATGQAHFCAAQAGPLNGTFSLDAALDRLLAGTGCRYRWLDAVAVEIVRAPASPPAAAAPPRRTQVPAPAPAVPELLVVATRRPTAEARLAHPVSAVVAAQMESQGLHDAGDLAQVVPAMTVTNLGPGRDKILLRGLSDGPLTGRTQSMVGIYLDGVRLTYNAPDPDLRLVDMAQVEVLRGPQGALYGSGSLGGVVELVSAKPNLERRLGLVSLSAATTAGGRPSSVAEGAVNLPLATGRAAVRMAAYQETSGGYLDNAQLGLKSVNHSTRSGLRAAVLLRLDADWTLLGGLVGQAISNNDTQYVQAGQSAYVRRNALKEPHDNDFGLARLRLEGPLGDARLQLSSAVVSHDITSRYDATGAGLGPAPGLPIAYDDEDATRSLVNEAILTSTGEGRWQWLAGAFYAHTRQAIDVRLGPAAAGLPAVLAEARVDQLDEAALFGQASFAFGPRLALTLGGRAYAARNRINSRLSANGAVQVLRQGLSRTDFAPKIVLAYTLNDQASLYLQATEGYRTGGFNTTALPAQPLAPAQQRYGGDELWNYEAGGRLSLAQGRLAIRAAVFADRWTNVQSDQLQPSGLPYAANVGDARNLGVEGEAGYRSGGLFLQGQFMINGPELTKPASLPGRQELALAGVPRRSAGVSAQYAWPLADGSRLEMSGRYAYVGRSRLTFDATTSPTMGGYGVARLAAAWSTAAWRASLAVDNPAGFAGDTFAYGNPFTLRQARQVTPLRPRTVTISLTEAF